MLNRIIYLLCVSAVILFGLVGCGEEPDKESVVKWTNPQTETQKSSTEGGITDTSTSIIWSDQAPLEEKKEVAVYVTRTGTRYHRDGCGSLRIIDEAENGKAISQFRSLLAAKIGKTEIIVDLIII